VAFSAGETAIRVFQKGASRTMTPLLAGLVGDGLGSGVGARVIGRVLTTTGSAFAFVFGFGFVGAFSLACREATGTAPDSFAAAGDVGGCAVSAPSVGAGVGAAATAVAAGMTSMRGTVCADDS